jgi:HEPN domain-containing protein
MAFYRRSDLQAIAQAKFDDAALLLTHQRYSNAYYLAGYAVEIGLKACIARQITADTIPDKTFISDIYRHALKGLIGTAGLTQALENREKQDTNFRANWALVSQWNPETRYSSIDAYSAQIFLQAISDPSVGVFPWIKLYW